MTSTSGVSRQPDYSNGPSARCISTLIGRRLSPRRVTPLPHMSDIPVVCRRRVLTDVITRTTPPRLLTLYAPSIYVINAAALSKPGAVQHLAADLQSYGASVAVITETHLKTKHTDSIVSINGFTLYRRDRTGSKGGGVAVHVTSELWSSHWTTSVAANSALEIDWRSRVRRSAIQPASTDISPGSTSRRAWLK